jgi:hypothetical protein
LITNNIDTTPLSYIDLSTVLPMLKAITALDTTTFKNLRLVIEYNTKNTVVLPDELSPVSVSSVVQPLLCLDKLENQQAIDQFRKGFNGGQWNSWENEKVNIPSKSGAVPVQQISFKLSGLASNKMLGRVLLQKSSTDYTATGNYLFLSNGSLAQWNEKINFLINGIQLIPYDGITSPNQRLALLDLTFNHCNSISTCNSGSIFRPTDKIEDVNNRVGTLDYTAVNVGRKCNELVINYSRESYPDSGDMYNIPLTLNVIAEVNKTLLLVKGGYQVLYT